MRAVHLLAAVTSVLPAACGDARVANPSPDASPPALSDAPSDAGVSEAPGPPTYYRDVLPILQAHCFDCHLPGGVSSFRPYFASYDDVVSVSGLLELAVVEREMPPWPFEDRSGCRTFRDARRLDDDAIATVVAWVDAGLLEGDPDSAPAPPAAQYISLRSVDATVQTDAYAPGLGSALSRCFVADPGLDGAAFLTAFEALPENPSAVQQVTLYALDTASQMTAAQALSEAAPDPGYDCFGGPAVDGARLLGGVVWGGMVARMPDGTGVALESGAGVVVQVHYNVLGASLTAPPARVQVDLELAPGVRRRARFFPVQASPEAIATVSPGLPHAEVAGTATLSGPMEIFGVWPIMHTLGHAMDIDADTPSDWMCLGRITHWDFYNHRQVYWYESPVLLDADDRLSVRCDYNTLSRTDSLSSGQRFEDETCAAWLYAADRI